MMEEVARQIEDGLCKKIQLIQEKMEVDLGVFNNVMNLEKKISFLRFIAYTWRLKLAFLRIRLEFKIRRLGFGGLS